MALKHCLLIVAGLAAASAVSAADLPLPAPAGPPPDAAPSWLSNFYLHLGPGAVILDAGAKIYTPAGRYPGATIKIAPQVSLTAEVGYRFTPNWGVSMTLGIPPTATIEGAGTATGLGTLGTTTYGPVAVTGHYQFTNFGAFQPYIGLGPAYMIVFNSHDGAMTDLQVHSAWGAVAQVGADYMITQKIGLFVDMKKGYLRTTATGALSGTPIHSDVKLDPYVVSGGLTYRF